MVFNGDTVEHSIRTLKLTILEKESIRLMRLLNK